MTSRNPIEAFSRAHQDRTGLTDCVLFGSAGVTPNVLEEGMAPLVLFQVLFQPVESLGQLHFKLAHLGSDVRREQPAEKADEGRQHYDHDRERPAVGKVVWPDTQ